MVYRTSLETARKLPRHLRNEEIPSHIFTPRTYQVELLDVAKQKNTIVCLGSGSGKTFIAVMLIKELASQIRPPIQKGGKRSIFLVNSDSLVSQHAQCLQQHTDLSVGEYLTDLDPGSWPPDQWKTEVEKKQVLVMTSQIFVDLIVRQYIPLSSINVLIMDECHYSLQAHPYAQLMQYHEVCNVKERPRLLGLTSTLLSGKFKSPCELACAIKNLETILTSTAETSNLVTAEKYGTCPKQQVFECKNREDPTELTTQLEAILDSAVSFLYDCNVPDTDDEDFHNPRSVPKTALCECLYILHELGPWCCGAIATTLVKQLEKIDTHETMDLNKKFLKFAATQLRLVTQIFDQHFAAVYLVEEFLQYATPKVVRLIDILRDYKPDDDFMIIAGDDGMVEDSDMSDDSMDLSDDDDNEDENSSHSKHSKPIHIAIKRTSSQSDKQSDDPFESDDSKRLCGIVFVERKHVAYTLNKLIDELCAWDADLYFLKSHHILGHGIKRGSKREAMLFKKQEDILRRFRMQELNLLVSTSVLEEGVDIPKCNLVVRFNLPKDYRSYTQSKSLARAKDSRYILLVDENSMQKFNSELLEYKGIETVLLEKCQNRDVMTEEAPAVEGVEDLLPAYMPIKQDGAPRVTMRSGIALVNRYCAKLPSDAFTHLTPKCSLDRLEGSDPPMYCARLRLPINSPVKEEITGEAMPSKRLAQMAVALKTCEILHKEGELDDHLLPVGKEVFRYEDEESEWEDEVEEGQARPGTTKRKQYYIKKTAEALRDCYPRPDQQCMLYELNMILTGPITEDQNTRGRKLHAPEETTRTFGVLLSKSLPRVPLFPVYTRSGEVTVRIELVSDHVSVSEEEMEQLHTFHKFVFTNVLRLEKDPMVFSTDPSHTSYMVVPLNKTTDSVTSLAIDWAFVRHLGMHSSPVDQARIYDAKRELFVFKTEQFMDAVVMPSYRNIDQPQYFYVAEIRHDLNPVSPFPSPDLYKTFKDYYAVKYGLMITNTEQPLLDVDHTSARLNLLTPRYMNQKGVALPTSSADTKRARRENLQQKQILIPELCDVHIFPASLWRKAVCLPTILYRTNHLLLAEDLRVKIARETKIGLEKVPPDFCFPKLDFGFDTSPDKIKGEEKGTDSGQSDESDEQDEGQTETSAEKEPYSLHVHKDNHDEKLVNKTTFTAQSKSNISIGKSDTYTSITDQSESSVGGKDIAGQSKVEPSCSSQLGLKDPTNDQSEISVSNQSSDLSNGSCELRLDIPCEVGTAGSRVCDLEEEGTCLNQEDVYDSLDTVGTGDSDSLYNTAREEDSEDESETDRDQISNQDSSQDRTLSSEHGESLHLNSEICHKDTPRHMTNGFREDEKFDEKTENSASPDENRRLYWDKNEYVEILNQDASTKPNCEFKMSDIKIEFVQSKLPPNIGKTKEEKLFDKMDDSKITGWEGGERLSGWDDAIGDLGPDVLKMSDGIVDIISMSSKVDLQSSPLDDGYFVPSKDNKCIPSADDKLVHSEDCRCSPSSNDKLTPAEDGQSSPSSNDKLTPTEDGQSSPSSNDKLTPTEDGQSSSSSNDKLTPTEDGQSSPSSNDKLTPTEDGQSSSSSNDKLVSAKDDKCYPSTADKLACLIVDGCVPSTINLLDLSEDASISPQIVPADTVENASLKNDQIRDLTDSRIVYKECTLKESCSCVESGTVCCKNIKESTYPTSQCKENKNNSNDFKDTDLCDEKKSEIETLKSLVGNSDRVMQHNNVSVTDKPSKPPQLIDKHCDSSSCMAVQDYNSKDAKRKISTVELSLGKGSRSSLSSKRDFPEMGVWGKSVDESPVEEGERCHNGGMTKRPLVKLDGDVDLTTYIGPSPCTILQALTMSNANDFFSLERLETIGDSFLKYAITIYLYCTYPGIHEGKLSYLRSKQVSNYNLYRLGKKKGLPEGMVSSKFEPNENWLPSGYVINEEKRRGPVPKVPISSCIPREKCSLPSGKVEEIFSEKSTVAGDGDNKESTVGQSQSVRISYNHRTNGNLNRSSRIANMQQLKFKQELEEVSRSQEVENREDQQESAKQLMPYNLRTQQIIPDKSVADAVEALIGCYLTSCGKRAALLFMSWLGLRVFPRKEGDTETARVQAGSLVEELQVPRSPRLPHVIRGAEVVAHLLDGYDAFEKKLGYEFRDRSYLLQAFTHASYHYNTVTDCYQRLEFLGDAILDYVITRHLFEDSRKYSPGVLTDLRSALVNNNIFAALAVKWDFHKYFKAVSPALFHVIERFVARQKDNEDVIELDDEDDDSEDGEKVEMEIPKALGDIFESVAGAIYLDSGMSLDTVWGVYYRMMKPQIDQYLERIPKSPVRELLEMEPETAKFEKPERTMEGKIRVTVNVVGKGVFTGLGRNYRIAKSAAAKKALKNIKTMQAKGLV